MWFLAKNNYIHDFLQEKWLDTREWDVWFLVFVQSKDEFLSLDELWSLKPSQVNSKNETDNRLMMQSFEKWDFDENIEEDFYLGESLSLGVKTWSFR